MAEGNAKVTGLGTIIGIGIVISAGLGVVNGLFGAKLGLPSTVRSVLILLPVLVLAQFLARRRQKALDQRDKR